MAVEKPMTWEDAVVWLRAQPGASEVVRDAYYDDPLHEAAIRYWKSEEWGAVQEWLPPVGKALDVGAGRGIASYALARDGFAVTALEPNPSSIVGAGAIRHLAGLVSQPIEVVETFSEALPFDSGCFDLVFARAVLHHTSDMPAACREFFRVLKPGGRFIAIREHVISRKADLGTFLDQHPLHHLYGGENAFLLGEYKEALSRAGFTIERVIAPLQSPINYAPHTAQSLRCELASRLRRRHALGGLAKPALDIPGVWPIARALMSAFDNRPGRHYSFVARRQA